MLMWIKWGPRVLKTFHSLRLEGWFIWLGPGFKPIPLESNSSNLNKESLFMYLNFHRAKHAKALWRCDVCNKLQVSIDSCSCINRYIKISLVDLSILFFVKRFGFIMLNKNFTHSRMFLSTIRANMMRNIKRAKLKQ